MALRVAIRVDASVATGLGHLKRCLSLAAALQQLGAQVCVAWRALDLRHEALLAQAGVQSVVLPAPSQPWVPGPQEPVPHAAWVATSWQQDAQQTVQALASWQPHWVVVDHYGLDARWHQQVARDLGVRLAVIDDLADRALNADLLVDHNLAASHRDKYAGRLPAGTVLLGGPRFALLGPGYASAGRRALPGPVRSIGIFMGGVDAAGLSALALAACRGGAAFTGPVEIATTSANPHLATLQRLVANDPQATLTVDQPDLVDFLHRHDLQIGAGGGATWERCCVGVPTLAVVAAANQQAALAPLLAEGCAEVVEVGTPPDSQRLGQALHALLHDEPRRRHMAARAAQLVDGLGAGRVALRLAAHTLHLRPATMADAPLLHRWRNDPATRAVSGSAQEIAWDDHQRWMSVVLADPNRCLRVGRVGVLDVGVIRMDLCADGWASVSLYLDPALHGLGLGSWLLAAGERDLLVAHPQARGIVATVLATNVASLRLFEQGGYRFAEGLWRKDAAAVSHNVRGEHT